MASFNMDLNELAAAAVLARDDGSMSIGGRGNQAEVSAGGDAFSSFNGAAMNPNHHHLNLPFNFATDENGNFVLSDSSTGAGAGGGGAVAGGGGAGPSTSSSSTATFQSGLYGNIPTTMLFTTPSTSIHDTRSPNGNSLPPLPQHSDTAAASVLQNLQAFNHAMAGHSFQQHQQPQSSHHGNANHGLPGLTFGGASGTDDDDTTTQEDDNQNAVLLALGGGLTGRNGLDGTQPHSTPDLAAHYKDALFDVHNHYAAQFQQLSQSAEANGPPAVPPLPTYSSSTSTPQTSTTTTEDQSPSTSQDVQVPPRKQKGRRPTAAGSDSKTHKCTFPGCAWSFSRREHLKRHEKTHTQDRPFVCDVPLCGLKFSRLDNLNSHKRTHEKGKRTSQWHVAKITNSNASSADNSFNLTNGNVNGHHATPPSSSLHQSHSSASSSFPSTHTYSSTTLAPSQTQLASPYISNGNVHLNGHHNPLAAATNGLLHNYNYGSGTASPTSPSANSNGSGASSNATRKRKRPPTMNPSDRSQQLYPDQGKEEEYSE